MQTITELISNWTILNTVKVTMTITFLIMIAKTWKKIRVLFMAGWNALEDDYLAELKAHVTERWLRNRVLRKYAHGELANTSDNMLKVPGAKISHPIDKIFVPLTLIANNETRTSDNIMKLAKRILIIGEPGSGKSSLVRKLHLETCKENVHWGSKAPFSVVIELKSLSKPEKGKDWILKTIRKTLKEKKKNPKLEACFETASKGKGVLLFLDGLDEVATTAYSKVRDAIGELAEQLENLGENNRIILTMRSQFYKHVEGDYRWIFPTIAELKRFEASEVFEFLSRWPFKTKRTEQIAQIHKELVQRPSLREMCTNPLVLAMYVARKQEDESVITPTTRTEFYQVVTEELLYKRRAGQLKKAFGTKTQKNQREQILGQLAYEHLLDEERNRNQISHARAMKITEAVLKVKAQQAEAYFNELAKETGLVSEGIKSETWMFIHLTFCEYLAAHYAIKRQKEGWSKLVAKHRSLQADPQQADRLAEVLPFACGLVEPKDQAATHHSLKATDQNRMVMRCFYESKIYAHPLWHSFVEKMTKRLLKDSKQWTPEAMADLLWFTIVVGDANHESEEAPGIDKVDLESILKQLMELDESNTKSFILAYGKSDAEAALYFIEACQLELLDFPELIQANCHDPLFLTLLQARIIKDGERKKEWARMLMTACDTKSKLEFFANQSYWDQWSGPPANLPVQIKGTKKNFLEQLVNIGKYENFESISTKHERYQPLLLLPLLMLMLLMLLPLQLVLVQLQQHQLHHQQLLQLQHQQLQHQQQLLLRKHKQQLHKQQLQQHQLVHQQLQLLLQYQQYQQLQHQQLQHQQLQHQQVQHQQQQLLVLVQELQQQLLVVLLLLVLLVVLVLVLRQLRRPQYQLLLPPLLLPLLLVKLNYINSQLFNFSIEMSIYIISLLLYTIAAQSFGMFHGKTIMPLAKEGLLLYFRKLRQILWAKLRTLKRLGQKLGELPARLRLNLPPKKLR